METTPTLYRLGLDSPLGSWLLTTTETQAVSLDYLDTSGWPKDVRLEADTRLEKRLACMWSRYFKSEPVDFARIPVALPEAPFLASVLTALRTVPYGEVRSYQWLAQAIENPQATRAIGGALGRNPLPIIVPCHRIIAKNGSLGGFMQGHTEGSRLKIGLLGVEGALTSVRVPEDLRDEPFASRLNSAS